MNPATALSLILSLWERIAQLEQENAQLRAEHEASGDGQVRSSEEPVERAP